MKALRPSFLLIGFWLSMAWAVTASAFEVPPLTGPVVDQVGWFSADDKLRLETALRSWEQQGKAQLQVLIVPDLQGTPVEEVAHQVFTKWALGDAKGDNGVLFLISVADKRMRIEVGRGLEGAIPDVIAKRILADHVAPMMRDGQNADAVVVGCRMILERAAGEKGVGPRKRKKSDHGILVGIFVVFLLLQFLRMIGGGGGGGRRRGLRGAGWGATGLGGGWGAGGGGWSGGGGSGWSGGGGSSAGGGASSGW